MPDSGAGGAERPGEFEMRSSQDMYRDFPALVRSSFPLYVREAGPQVWEPPRMRASAMNPWEVYSKDLIC